MQRRTDGPIQLVAFSGSRGTYLGGRRSYAALALSFIPRVATGAHASVASELGAITPISLMNEDVVPVIAAIR